MNKRPSAPPPRKGMPSPRLHKGQFRARYLERFEDPGFGAMRGELDRIADIAWDAYRDERKSPHTVKAGKQFADPDYDLPVEWLAARKAVEAARADHERTDGVCRLLIINVLEHRFHVHRDKGLIFHNERGLAPKSCDHGHGHDLRNPMRGRQPDPVADHVMNEHAANYTMLSPPPLPWP